MSPFRHASITLTKPPTRIKPPFGSLTSLTTPSTQPSSRRPFTSYTSSPNNPIQIFHSTSADPYVNLSIEHHLLTASHPSSTVLFLYRNRPSIIIGRNQNPWLETHLSRLRAGLPSSPPPSPSPQPISLVRRRSGGGAVFHDAGNANWSVICPAAAFDRDRHAEMVVRALARRLGVRGARVNERHDIVQDVDVDAAAADEGTGAATATATATFKVSGSAYKLTRLRSLHHGTCLLRSPNLGRIGPLLRSPAEPYVKARGVESVRSPVRNVGVGYEEFVDAVVEEFREMYGGVAGESRVVGDEALEIAEVRRGVDELQSPEWIYGQTPQFTFSTSPLDTDPRPRPDLPGHLPKNLDVCLTVRHGEIQDARVSGLRYAESLDGTSQDQAVSKALVGQALHEIEDWHDALEKASPVPLENDHVGKWLDGLFGVGPV